MLSAGYADGVQTAVDSWAETLNCAGESPNVQLELAITSIGYDVYRGSIEKLRGDLSAMLANPLLIARDYDPGMAAFVLEQLSAGGKMELSNGILESIAEHDRYIRWLVQQWEQQKAPVSFWSTEMPTIRRGIEQLRSIVVQLLAKAA